VTHAAKWDRAVLCADAMVGASRGGARGDQVHWNERASALLAPLLHAAAIDGASMTDVVRSVNRRDPSEFVAVLTRREAVLPLDTLIGILETDERERSGIFSTASSVLAAYRTEAALESASLSPLDTAGFLADRNTCFVLGSGEHQRHLAPLIAGLVSDIRHDAYAHTAAGGTHRSALLVLDELANIAPLEDLPSLVSEGSSQGLVTLACLQDLSQARARWGEAADGFLSLFGTKVVLPGIGDRRTLEALSILSGDRDVQTLSVGGNRRRSRRTWTRSTRQERHIPPDVIANGPPGSAIVAVGAGLRRVALTPAHTTAPFDRLITLDTSGHADDVGASIAIERNGQPRATGRSRSHDPRTR
jgi:type IV secretory pathway TraG/TraD family ATPase VirD4